MGQKLLISFSGGRTSAYMTWWLLNQWKDCRNWEMKVVFANTGRERKETLDFVQRCDDYFGFGVVWVEAIVNPQLGYGIRHRIVNFDTASRNGEPFESVIKKFGLPSQANASCSRDLKRYVIMDYARSIGWKQYYNAIGIRADEPQRLNWERAKKDRVLYPLANLHPTNKSDINLFWSGQPFDLELKSYEGNCDLCWKKSMRKLMTLVKEKPELADWWREMEKKYEMHVGEARKHNPKIKPPLRFFRGNLTVDEIIEEAQFPFEPARDESKDIDKFKQLAMWNYELDTNDGCVESCEAF